MQSATLADAAIIRVAVPADAAALAEFAERCFCDTFARDNVREDMERYVAGAFSTELQRADISDPGSVVVIMEVNSRLAGYAHVRSSPTPDEVNSSSPVELKRFYIAHAWHGHGLAQRLMRRVLDYARDQNADVVWLAVWERNPRAISFYRKSGFTDVGSWPFLLGNDSQTDRIMSRAICD